MVQRVGVVGGGIVGVAVARALVDRGLEAVVLEKEGRLAQHQSGHNSGVVHAGLYYAPGSLKAVLCARGRAMTRDYCQERGLPYRELGKLVVALDGSELAALERIEERSRANQVPGLRRLGAAEMREVEPHVAGVAALHSPHTAATDYSAVTEAMASDVRAGGGAVLLGQAVTRFVQEGGRVRIVTGAGAEHVVDRVVVCAGLQSDVVAALAGAPRGPVVLPFRGEYWTLDPRRSDLVRGMIYPVPDPRFPFLGVHFTRGVHDEVHVGPNAVPALAREGYRWRDVSLRDTWASLTWPGAPALARQHWRMGLGEVSASVVKALYHRQARRFVPELRLSDLRVKTHAGVRAQAWGRDGTLLDDFAVDQVGSITLVRNAPSPAATSAMAIADHVLEQHLRLR